MTAAGERVPELAAKMDMNACSGHSPGDSVTRARFLRKGLLLLTAACLALPAGAITFGEADVRSFTGQPLDVRIAIQAPRNEWVELACFKVRTGDGSMVPVPPRRLRLDETLDTKLLVVQTDAAVNSPFLTLEVTVQCEGQAAPVTRTYDLSLPPLVVPSIILHQPGAATTSAAAPVPVPATLSASGVSTGQPAVAQSARGPGSVWVTGARDTLNHIAHGIYPHSVRMRVAFLQRLREANTIALPGDDAVLAANRQIRLPDLVALANASPRIDPAASTGIHTASTAATGTAMSTSRLPTAAMPMKAAVITHRKIMASTSPGSERIPLPVSAPASPAGAGGGFSLRLSTTEMDLSRSKGVSEAARAALRDKQLLLDADDQVAALLSLRHTAKQLENRLNDLHLKLSTTTQPPPASASNQPTPPVAAAVPKVATAGPKAVVAEPKAVAAEPKAVVTMPKAAVAVPTAVVAVPKAAVAAQPALPASPPAAPAPPLKPGQIGSAVDLNASMLPLRAPLLFLGSLGALVLLLGWLGLHWVRSGKGLSAILPPPVKKEDPIPAQPAQSITPSTAWHAPPHVDMAGHDQTIRMQAPMDVLDSAVASLEIDPRPATSVDFILGEDSAEDKSRRQRYMEERFPELAHHSMSVNDPDSIIDAARHHYEEGHLQKATELLTYAFEEQPGQLRFWLALFEIYRLEQRANEFHELAVRFKNVHGGTDAWPRVQHIGRDFDPDQPMYSAALGHLGTPMGADFDPASANWLNLPMDFTSDMLMIELRHSLMAEHGVDDPELARPILEVPA